MKNLTTALLISASLYSVNAQASWLDAGKNLINQAQTEVQKATGNTSSNTSLPAGLSSEDISKAFKQALTKGSQTVVAQLGVKNGFNKNPAIRIPLPDGLKKVKSALDRVGMSHLMDDLETKINRAAEKATPQAKVLFINAIQDMSFDDVQKIYNGPNDSATKYLYHFQK